MKLIIDKGNTATKLAVYNQEKVIDFISVVDFDQRSFQAFIECYPAISKVILSSVSEIPIFLKDYLTARNGIILNSQTRLPINITYKDKETLGQDRVALAVAAAFLFPGENSLVISLGTCVTYNFVDSSGSFRGGAISPGLHQRFKSLNQDTFLLPLLQPSVSFSLIGDTTQGSILNGVMKGLEFEVCGAIEAYGSLYPNIKIIITGGDMKYFDFSLKNRIFAIQNLALTGLNQIMDYNV